MIEETETDKGLHSFVEAMKLKLDLNQEKKGDSWTTCEIDFLENKLLEEIKEYLDEPRHGKKSQELGDIANVCMMLYHRHFNLWAEEAAERMFGSDGHDSNTGKLIL